MSKQAYLDKRFSGESLALIETMNAIVKDYIAQGYRLTVRQLYYQLVARGHIENTERSYKRIVGIVSDGRLAGLIDWDAIEDRTRAFIRRTRWDSGSQILRSCERWFHMDMWANQARRVFVLVEKEALAGVLERVCEEFDVPLLAARGYPSGTVLREFTLSDLYPCVVREKKRPIILHLGDHDPSGIDMSRDLCDRLGMFLAGRPNGGLDERTFERLALNMPQIEELNPPPNPAKITDSRFEGYRALHGDESWELDALPPEYLSNLVRENIQRYIDEDAWAEREHEIERVKERIGEIADEFDARN
jgi:hypothetical protein